MIYVLGYASKVLERKDIKPDQVYMAKPYDIQELKSRARRLLREGCGDAEPCSDRYTCEEGTVCQCPSPATEPNCSSHERICDIPYIEPPYQLIIEVDDLSDADWAGRPRYGEAAQPEGFEIGGIMLHDFNANPRLVKAWADGQEVDHGALSYDLSECPTSTDEWESFSISARDYIVLEFDRRLEPIPYTAASAPTIDIIRPGDGNLCYGSGKNLLVSWTGVPQATRIFEEGDADGSNMRMMNTLTVDTSCDHNQPQHVPRTLCWQFD